MIDFGLIYYYILKLFVTDSHNLSNFKHAIKIKNSYIIKIMIVNGVISNI